MGRSDSPVIGPLDITPEALAQEAMRLQAKLGAGLQTLRQVGDTGYGATP